MIGIEGLKTIRDFDLKERIVFLRLDLNVPLSKGVITDDNRIRESLPTIKYAIEKGAKLVMASHMGRPKSAQDREFSLEPVAQALTEKLGVEVILVEEPASEAMTALITGLRKNQIILLENLRYEAGETENSGELAQKFAAYSDVYINDAFGACHRAHASIDALPRLMKNRGVGFLIEKEIQVLETLLKKPKAPYWTVLGGSKVSDKIGVIENLLEKVDGFIIGGAMAYTFIKAMGHPVGKSRVETDKLNYARELMARLESRGKSLLLPVDHVVAGSLQDKTGQVVKSIPDDMLGLDIGPESIRLFSQALRGAATVFWNGPMGVFETPAFSKGTFALANVLAECQSFRVIGGGDSAAAVAAAGVADKMSHISTGGGASLEYLQGDRLPGLDALRPRKDEGITTSL